MTELQSGGEAAQDTQAQTPDANPAMGADLANASESEGQHEAQAPVVDEVAVKAAEQKTGFEKRIGKVTGEKHQLQRDLDSSNAELEGLRQKEREREAAKFSQAPPLPDEYAENPQEMYAAREKYITEKAAFDARQNLLQQQQQAQAITAQNDAQYQHNQDVIGFDARAAKAGISAPEMQKIVNDVRSYQMPADLQTHFLNLEDGPMLLKQLVTNPNDIITLSNLDPNSRGEMIVELREKAKQFAPKQTNTPPPVEQINGGGVVESRAKNRPNSARGKVY